MGLCNCLKCHEFIGIYEKNMSTTTPATTTFVFSSKSSAVDDVTSTTLVVRVDSRRPGDDNDGSVLQEEVDTSLIDLCYGELSPDFHTFAS